MAYIQDLITNSATIDYFDHLKESNLAPQLALYRGRTLMVVSYKAEGILGTIYQIFLKIQTFFYNLFGLLDYDGGKIDAIKTKVTQYHYDKCANLRANDTNVKDAEKTKIEEENRKTVEFLKKEIEKLVKSNASLKTEVEKLESSNFAVENKKLETEKEEMVTKYNELVDELEKVSADSLKLIETNKNLKNEHTILKQDVEGQIKAKQAYKGDLAKAENENEDLTKQNINLNKKIRELALSNKNLSKENENLKDNNETLEKKNEALQGRFNLFKTVAKDEVDEAISKLKAGAKEHPKMDDVITFAEDQRALHGQGI